MWETVEKLSLRLTETVRKWQERRFFAMLKDSLEKSKFQDCLCLTKSINFGVVSMIITRNFHPIVESIIKKRIILETSNFT